MSGLKDYYWLLRTDEPGELFGELFQSINDSAALRAAADEARASLPAGVHRIAVARVRGDASSYVLGTLEIAVGAVACA